MTKETTQRSLELAQRVGELESTINALGRTLEGHSAWLADLERVAALRSELASVESSVASLGDVMDAAATSLGGTLEGHSAWLADLERWVRSCARTLALFGSAPLPGAPESAPDAIGRLLSWVEIQTVMSWIRDAARIVDGPLVSVAMATRDRPALLERAIASVLAQSYKHLELVVVDDSDGARTGELLAKVEDPRLRIIRTPERRGAGAAFNVALDAAEGELVAFLDDDNLMHQDWLRSIVWAFGQRPHVQALYGARIIEDPGGEGETRSDLMPAFEFLRYDRRRHERSNFVDRNALAVRSTLRMVRFDERLAAAVDWDHSLRLFAKAPPLALPAVACYYRTLTPNRLTSEPRAFDEVRTVRSRAHTSRPLRVHVHTDVSDASPLVGDLVALASAGAVVTLSSCRDQAPIEGAGPWQRDLDEALAEAQPDVILLLSVAHASRELERLERHGIPFAVRAADAGVTPGSIADHQLYLGPLDRSTDPEQALRLGLTRWLYARG